ncbi:hypothetical protein ACVXZY_08370 [Staphylococcus aureus]
MKLRKWNSYSQGIKDSVLEYHYTYCLLVVKRCPAFVILIIGKDEQTSEEKDIKLQSH